MPNYKDTDNKVHFLDDAAFAHLLPDGCVPITDEEALSLAPQPVSIVPTSVTMRQARIALSQAGLLSTVNSAIAAMTGSTGDIARIEWEFSSTVERNRPFVQSMKAALSLTDKQLDDLFTLAATL